MSKNTIQRWLPPLIAFIWPFLFFIRFIIPINGHYQAIGNDFSTVYYPSKPYLLDRLIHLTIPLWSPAEAAGYPFYSSPIAQVFYPLNLPLAFFYKLAGGFSLLDYQVYTILGLAIFSLGLYLWLKTFGYNWRVILFATLCISVSFKISETSRFPNSVHEAAWYPWILLAVTCIFRSITVKQWIGYGLLLFFALYCLFTAGYPYFILYLLFLIGPYLLALLIPGLQKRFWGVEFGNILRPFLVMLASAFSVLLVCLPYLLNMQELLKQTASRGGGTWIYATSHEFTFINTLGSLLFPPATSAEGLYFFGVLGLLFILLYLLGGFAKIQAGTTFLSALLEDRWVKLYFILWFILISLVTYGKYSILFAVLWKTVPFFQQLRVWGRLNIVLLPVLAWILAISYSQFERLVSERNEGLQVKGIARWRPEITLSAIYLCVLSIQIFLYVSHTVGESWIHHVAWVQNSYAYIVLGGIAFLTLLTILIISFYRKINNNRVLFPVLIGLVIISASEKMVVVGGIFWQKDMTTRGRVELKIHEVDLLALGRNRKDDCFEISLTPTFCLQLEPNWHYNRYRDFLARTENEKDARDVLLGKVDGNRLFFSQKIDSPSIQAFLDDAGRYPAFSQVETYTGDDLALKVKAPVDGYVSFIDNWDKDWKAFVDGQPVPIELLFGTFKSIKLKAGEHEVLFSYQPPLFRKIDDIIGGFKAYLSK